MPNEEHVEILKQGRTIWDRWRYENPHIRPDLYCADLSNNDLSYYNLEDANLFHSNLKGANLSKAKLNRANLAEATLRDAIIRNAVLEEADLSRATCIHSDFSGSNLYKACLSGTNLTEANISQVDFRETDFSFAILLKANIRGSCLSRAIFNKSQLQYANLDKTSLDYSVFVNTSLENASIKDSYVYGVSTWDLESQGSIQSDLVITPNGNPYITVDNIEVAQFIYLLLNNQKIRDVINTITSKVVLILGRFTPDRFFILDALRNELRKHNYMPVIFDFEKPNDRNFIETVSILAHMSRFIIADFTDAKIVLQEAEHIIRDISIPFMSIMLEGSGREPITLYDLRKGKTFVPEIVYYQDISDLVNKLPKQIVEQAEKICKTLFGENPIKGK